MPKTTDKTSGNDLFSQPSPFDEPSEDSLPQGVKPELTIDMVTKSRNRNIESIEANDTRKKNITTSESLAMESTKQKNAIYLFRRGSFLRAYNGSAWLVSALFRSDYKILRDKQRGGEQYVYLGFPQDKISDVFGDGNTIEEQEGYIQISLDEALVKNAISYDKWLKEAKISYKKETDLPHEANIPISSSMHISNSQEIALRLATYHMENHTMIENMQFLANLIASIEYK